MIHFNSRRILIVLNIVVFTLLITAIKPLKGQHNLNFGKNLPTEVDNSLSPWFPPVYSQKWFPNCQQASGVYHAFTYAINRMRGDTVKGDEQIMATNFTYNFYDGESQDGVSFLHSYELIRENGQPSRADFGDDHVVGGLYWMSGYEKYYRAMQNRIDKIIPFPVNTEEGLHSLRQWLYDHHDGSQWGGVAVFSAHAPYSNEFLPPESPYAGYRVMPMIVSTPSHGMTIVGYHDSVCYDLNGDGRFTLNEDINLDGRIDLGDWEKGGFIVVNSYGPEFGNNGRFFLMYSAFAQGQMQWGAQNECVWAVIPKVNYTPLMTARFTITHNLRDRIRLKAGISLDTARIYPESIHDFQIFQNQGNGHVMTGLDGEPGSETLEAGLDLTPLLSRVKENTPFKVFLIVDQKLLPDGAAKGQLNRFSVITGKGEFISGDEDLSLDGRAQTLASVVVSADMIPFPRIANTSLPLYHSGVPYQAQLQGQDGTPPYTFSLKTDYQYYSDTASLPVETLTQLTVTNARTRLVPVDLPFAFPFYGKTYNRLYVSDNGTINFDSLSYPYAYIRDAKAYLKSRLCIAGAYSMSGIYYRPEGDEVYADIREDQASFSWKVTSGITGDVVEPFVKIFPSGRIEIYRQAFEGAFPDKVFYGISEGDGLNFQMNTYDESNIQTNLRTLFLPSQPSPGIHLTEEGILTMEPQQDSNAWKITARITDNQGLYGEKVFDISPDLQAQCSTEPISGQSAHYLQIWLSNRGSATPAPLHLQLETDHPDITILQGEAFAGILQPGDSVGIRNTFRFETGSHLSNAQTAAFRLKITSEGYYRLLALPLTIQKPEIKVKQVLINDGHNHTLDPGETAEIEITLINTGDSPVSDLQWKLKEADSLLHVIDTLVQEPMILKAGFYTSRFFRLSASREAENGNTYNLYLDVDDGKNFSKRFVIAVKVGKTSVLMVDLSKSTHSSDTLGMYLDALRIPWRKINTSAIDYSAEAIFLLLGTHPNGYLLRAEEANRYASYLSAGGNLYIEGYNYWHYAPQSNLNKYLKFETLAGPVHFYDSLTGNPENFASGKKLEIAEGMYMAIFQLQMLGNSLPLFSSDVAEPKTLIYSKDTTYRVIGSVPEIGNLRMKGKKNLRTLVKDYCHFFNLDTSGLVPLFHTLTRRVNAGDTVRFHDDSYEGVNSREWSFPGGSPSVSGLEEPSVVYDKPGIYPVQLSVGNGTTSRSLIREGYIIVANTQGEEENPSFLPRLTLWPNPARDEVKILNPFNGKNPVKLEVYDLSGKRQYVATYPCDKVLTLSISSLRPGSYLISLSQNHLQARGLLVKL